MNKRINILLVDDRPEGLIALEAVLKAPELNLITANSGEEALAHILSNDFAVILLDVQMPIMDGFETAKLIKQREKSRNIPIIFMTANNKADHYISTGYSVGAVDYVLKPFDPNILKSKVSVFVDLYKKNILIQEQSEALRSAERQKQLQVLQNLEMEGRRRYQNLADAIPQIVFRAAIRGLFEYVNQFWYSYTRQNQKNNLAQTWRQAFHPKDILIIDKKWEDAEVLRVGFECECRVRQGQSGEYRWHMLRVVPEFNVHSELVNWIGVASEIHEQKLTQQELILAKRLAEAASETKSRFLANMSHEIRTPLGVILGFSELLIDTQVPKDEKDNAILAIRRNGEQLSRIINEILDLSKVEAGKMDVDRTEMAIADLLLGVKSFMSLPAKEKNIDLKFAIKGKIPKRILSNYTRLHQILINLISNGIKFSPSGEIIVTTWFEQTAEDKSQMYMSVQDSGPGLDAEQIENLFQPFTQLDTSMTRKHGGAGLGLALSRRLARALGGDITVAPSEPNKGCDFILSFDVGTVGEFEFTDTLEKTEIIKKPSSTPTASLDGIQVLLVEDSVDNQVLVSRFLTKAGAHVEIASNGVEGVAKAVSGTHDIVLMDIQMPELDGYGAITQLRQQGFAKPIIALTAHGMVEDRLKCLELGSTDHLTKPIDRRALIERIKELSITEQEATLHHLQ